MLEPGEFELAVGASSRDLPLATAVHVDAPRVPRPLGPMSSLDEWLADPEGARPAAGGAGDRRAGRFVGTLGDPEMRTVVGNFPLQALAGMDVIEIDRDVLAGLVARLSR